MNDQNEKIGRQHFSKLDSHHRDGKVLTPPLLRVPAPLRLHSWVDERLPECLWAVLLTGTLTRQEYMPLLSAVAKAAMRFRDEPKAYIDHSALAEVSPDQFNSLFKDVLGDERACSALIPLLLLENLPDRAHWSAHLQVPEPEVGWRAMAHAVVASMDLQSRSAIDIRWMRVMFLGLQHRLRFPKGREEVIDMLCAYPEGRDVPDWADSMIRAMEPMMGIGDPTADEHAAWSEVFWRECLRKTPCMPGRWALPSEESDFDFEPAKQRWGETYAGLAEHFFETLETTGIDARHDAVFGLALYAMSLVASAMRPHSTRPSGRHLLRSLAEVLITLAYLVVKDEPELWQTYRAYGTGQAKLAFLKLVESERKDLPKHVDLSVLESLANEDMWQEFVPIDFGNWTRLNVRKMAEASGIKDVYDAYYVWPSGYVHGHWAAVRDSVFDICANPLHRFHRIPRPARVDMPDVCFDAIDLMNRTLDLVDKAYPSFAARFDQRSSEVAAAPAT